MSATLWRNEHEEIKALGRKNRPPPARALFGHRLASSMSYAQSEALTEDAWRGQHWGQLNG